VNFTVSANTGNARTAAVVIAGQSVAIDQDAAAPNCASSTVSPRTVSISASDTNGSISVTAPSGCEWSASSNASWITLSGRTSVSGTGTVAFNVTSNGGISRTGTLTVAGQTVTVSQALNPALCASSSVNPTTVSIGSSGGAAGPFAVAAIDECAWSATSNASWLSITSGANGTGDGTVAVNVAVNTGDVRTGTLTIANRTVTVNQGAAPCSYSVVPSSVSISATGGTGPPLSVNTFSVCAWSATSNASWVTILSGAGGTGSGTLTYSVLANTGDIRTGTLTVAGRTVPITQSAPCTYAISPAGQSFSRLSGTGGPISVTTQVGCTWTAVSKVNWVTVTSGASGTGNGTVTFSVMANEIGGNRRGEIVIAGLTFTVTQEQSQTCKDGIC
jgi:hypothetical protein